MSALRRLLSCLFFLLPLPDLAEAGQKPSATLAEVQPPGLGVRFQAPASWKVDRVDGHTVLVSGPRNTRDYVTTVTLTNQETPSTGVSTLVSDYLAAIRSKGTQEVLREAPFNAAGATFATDGLQTVVRFQGASGPIRQWLVAIPRTDIPVSLLILYSAPDEEFERGLTTARALVESLSFTPAEKGKKK